MAKAKENKKVKAVKAEVKDEKKTARWDEEIRYIISKIKRSKDGTVGHYSYLLKSTLDTISAMGIEYKPVGKHGYLFTVPEKKSGAWRKMCAYGKVRDEKGHFVKA